MPNRQPSVTVTQHWQSTDVETRKTTYRYEVVQTMNTTVCKIGESLSESGVNELIETLCYNVTIKPAS